MVSWLDETQRGRPANGPCDGRNGDPGDYFGCGRLRGRSERARPGGPEEDCGWSRPRRYLRIPGRERKDGHQMLAGPMKRVAWVIVLALAYNTSLGLFLLAAAALYCTRQQPHQVVRRDR